ncbi:metal ABC transporter permease [Elusimicrobiota bacterium]
MIEVLQYGFIQRALIASIFGGIACGIVGVWVILLSIPFVGVAMAHAAFAGAIFGLLFNINPIFSALLFSLVSSFFIGPIADKGGFSPNISISLIFSFVLGLAFLGIGFLKETKTQALDYLWGNILTISWGQVLFLIIIFIILMIIIKILHKEILAVLFNREIARASGIPEKYIFYLLLILSSATVTLNLSTIGGLLVFSLIIGPSSAAYQISHNLKGMYLLSSLFAVISCITGLALSYLFNVPTGAIIIMIASIIFFISLVFSPKRKMIRI